MGDRAITSNPLPTMAIVPRLQLALWRKRVNLFGEPEDFLLLQFASAFKERCLSGCFFEFSIFRPQFLKLADQPAGLVVRHATKLHDDCQERDGAGQQRYPRCSRATRLRFKRQTCCR